jgi:two-component system response regulator GlrR
MNETPHVLLVDDDLELCELITMRMEANGYRLSVAHNVASALDRVGRQRFDAILLDLRLGEEDGLRVLDGTRKRSPDVPIIILTAHGTIDTAVEAMRRGAFGFATKPFHDHELLQKVAHACESHRLRREVAGLRRLIGEGLTSLVGTSRAIEDVRERIDRVGPTDATVLILGESGVGKELVARSIHAVSQRANGPFVAVNCAGLTPDLLESTLFGHMRGAFTGAIADREGLLAAAKKGTLFLDEIGETPPAVQAKLLRVLEDRRYTRVGSTNEEVADVRVVAATNRDLRLEVAERRFREDLFYRLHVVPLTVRPLRERKEDVPILAELFLERVAGRHNVAIPRLSSEALNALVEHSWPGNVRELANVIEASVLLCRDGEVGVEQLSGIDIARDKTPALADDLSRGLGRIFEHLGGGDGQRLPTLRDVRDVVERAYLEAVLLSANGSVSVAAKMAGRNRTDFYDLLRRHSVSPSSFKRTG